MKSNVSLVTTETVSDILSFETRSDIILEYICPVCNLLERKFNVLRSGDRKDQEIGFL
jgi:hypothetical protein